MKKKLMFIASHLSTGGMPQYLFKQIELLQDNFEIYCIEWDDITGGRLVVQRNKIKNLLNEKLITLRENKEEIFNYIKTIEPDFIHLQECPEYFIPHNIAEKLYRPGRKYIIIETSHDSSFDVNNKKHFPDKFMMVSQYQINNFKSLEIPCELVEYPIEYKKRTKSREELLLSLGLDPNLKHVINIGLFTPRKNQAEIIEYAKKLQNYPIQFHFIGNQADNFKWYWEPLMKDFPTNCKWWDERTDVDTFYEMADLFLFTSKGTEVDKETMPLVIREAIGWKVPSLIYNLPVYINYFDKFDNISYLDFNNLDVNYNKILNKLDLEKTKPTKECIIISTYIKTKSVLDLTKECILESKKFNIPIILTSHCEVPEEIQQLVDYCIVDKNNILTKHTFYKCFWGEYDNFDLELNIDQENNDSYHGPAVYTNYYNGISLAKMLGFDNAYCYNFDIIIKDNIPITKGRNALLTKKALMNLTEANEGNALRTVWHAINIDFFLQNFPKISNENDYNNWYLNINSESNGLENMYYNTLKNNLDKIEIINDDDFYGMFENSKIDVCSQIEYFTVLPIKDNNQEAVIYYFSSHKQDSREFLLYINGILVDNKKIYNKIYYYRNILLNFKQNIKLEVIDENSKKILYTREINITPEYILNQLPKNGFVKFK